MGTVVVRAGKKSKSFEAQAKRTDPITGKVVRKTSTFKSEREAKDWIAEFETEILKSKVKEVSCNEILLKTAIEDYITQKLSKLEKISKGDDINRLNKWKESKYGEYSLPQLSYKVFMSYVNDRRKDNNRSGKPIAEQTIKHELQVISNLFEWLMIEHEDLINPIKRIPANRKPNGSREVDIRISRENQMLLLQGLASCKGKEGIKQKQVETLISKQRKMYATIAEFAIETAMRQGEILRLKKKDLHFTKPVYVTATDFRTTKEVTAAYTRAVVLTDRARELLQFAVNIEDENALIFGEDFNELKLTTAFTEIAKTIPGMETATFHSTRHEAISRMVEAGMSRENIMKISGHKTSSQLNRYFNARPEGLSNAIAVMNKPVEIKPEKRLYRRWFYYKQFECRLGG